MTLGRFRAAKCRRTGKKIISVKMDSKAAITATLEIEELPEGYICTASETGIADTVAETKLFSALSTSAPQIDETKFNKQREQLNQIGKRGKK